MLVSMNAQISGTRDGVAWPAIGEVLEVPDAEGQSLVDNGYAVQVEAPKPVRVAAKAERAVPTAKPETAAISV